MLNGLFSDPGFMPHIHCYLDSQPLVWTMVITDLLIGAAYVAISLTLWALIRRIRLQFNFVVVCFGLFIGACGATHFMEVWTLWMPDYWFAAALKIVTAAASVGTGIYLFRLRHDLYGLAESARLSEDRRVSLERLTNDLELRVQDKSDRLELSEKRYETLTSTIPQLVWTCLPDGACNYLSKQWQDYTGIPVGEQLDLNWLDRVIYPDDRERTYKHWMGAVKGLHDYDIEYRIRRHDGEYRWFQTRGTPIRSSMGEIQYWVGTCTDVQAQKVLAAELLEAKQVAERASDAKTQFLANMSHEIRTPIGAITGFTEMLKGSDVSDSDRQNFMMIIERNSKHLLRLIDDILDLSKVKAGKITFENATFSLPEFLSDVEALMGLRAADKGIGFALSVNGSIPDKVVADQLRLKQILSNVIGNAIKFTEQGRVVALCSYANETFQVDVIDTGVGIREENIQNLFQAFSQADPSLNRKFGGTGLGLILSRKLAQHLEGDLVLKRTQEGEGSHFVTTIKLDSAKESKVVKYQNTNQEENDGRPVPVAKVKEFSGLKILVVEDSPDNRVLISTYLKKTGIEILMAENGVEGVSMALSSKPDLILMDIQMPEMDGHEATRKLRTSGFTKPIVALTAHAMREERDRCVESGFTDYLTKPIQRDVLLERLQHYLNVSNTAGK